MSTGAQVAMLGPSGRRASPPRLRVATAAEQPAIRIVSFAALGFYGVLRWSTLLSGGEEGRLLALLALSIALAGSGLVVRSRVLRAIAAVLAVLAALAIAGVPLSWIVNLRVAVTARAIGDGIAALPRTSVPYGGINHWVRTVNVLGAGVLLFDAALLLAFAPRSLGDIRRAAAALPLIALATVPATLLHPALPYVQGFLLFALLAAFAWGERVRREQGGMAVAVCALAAVAAMAVAPALDRHKAWINPATLGGSLAPAHVETFNWAQTYRPFYWPRKGRAVFEVQAPRPEYWKAENLDEFDGTGWVAGTVFLAGDPRSTVSQATIKRWTQPLQVTIAGMSTSDVIAAGDAIGPPQHLPETRLPGLSPDTYTTATPIGPGDSYTIEVYDPNPSPARLASAGSGYPQTLVDGYLTVGVPGAHSAGPGDWVVLPPFHSGQRAYVRSEHAQELAYGEPTSADPVFARLDSVQVDKLMAASPYAGAYALAQRLARSARTPYAFVTAVKGYLAHGHRYSETPPPSRYPIETFLLSAKRGYCQQFAGAMALLLRMGGVPARVAAGFTTGSYDSATNQYVVSDLDAHVWVEVWFPHYGWVEFDPTPPQDPALSGQVPNPSLGNLGTGGPGRATGRPNPGPPVPAATRVRHPSRAGSVPGALAILGIIAALALAATGLLVTRPLPGGEALVAELERALTRAGRPVRAGTTLSAIEHRLGPDTDAAAYVRALRLARFGGAVAEPSPGQRRALRAQLGSGLGPLGRLRALWALPPRRKGRAPGPAAS